MCQKLYFNKFNLNNNSKKDIIVLSQFYTLCMVWFGNSGNLIIYVLIIGYNL